MNIVIWTPFPLKSLFYDDKNFIVETFMALAKEHATETFHLLTTAQFPDLQTPNIHSLSIGDIPSNTIMKRVWQLRLSRLIKRLKADLFISWGGSVSAPPSTPFCIILDGTAKSMQSDLRNATSIIVLNQATKKQLIEKPGLQKERISVVYPFPDNYNEPPDFETRQDTKTKYTDGNEFFLYNSSSLEKENFINLLKSFSHFKKRQKSNFNLLINAVANTFFQKSLEGYKYRNEVKFISLKKEELALVTAGAYAVVLPFNTSNDIPAALNAMQSGIPVIATKDSAINEIAADAVLNAETNTFREIGDKLIQIYTDENYRSALIEKGRDVAKTFTLQKTAKSLWQAVMKAVR